MIQVSSKMLVKLCLNAAMALGCAPKTEEAVSKAPTDLEVQRESRSSTPPVEQKKVTPAVASPREDDNRASSSAPATEMNPPRPELSAWRPVSRGVAYRVFSPFGESEVGRRELHVVRITPRLAIPRLLMVSRDGGEARTAAAWCRDEGLRVAINAGMYLTDFKTHVGYLRDGAHVNSPKWNRKYRSALVWERKKGHEGSLLEIVDIAVPEDRSLTNGYRVVAQNLGLIKGVGKVAWKQQPKRWSEAAAAVDNKGRLLLLFSRSPYSIRAFGNLVLSLPLGVVRAQHLEGGPEASLSIHGGGVDVDLSGSFETGFNENDDNREQWPLPNVIGL